MKTTEEPIVLEAEFTASVIKVWEAISCVDSMRQWYFENIPEFQPEVDFRTQFSVESGERTFTHSWRVVRAESLSALSYEWSYQEYEGSSIVSFELSEQGNRTLLRLTHKATQDFVEDIPEFKREMAVDGWDYLINDRLKSFLES